MNVILLTGRGGSKSIAGKNVQPLLGRPLAYYPMAAAREARRVDAVYVTTDCPGIKRIAAEMDIRVIDRPADLARDDSELVDALMHAMQRIEGEIDLLVTMHCNCAVHRKGLVDECIERLVGDPEADSCVTGYIDHAVHPFRTKRITGTTLAPWMDMPAGTSTNRQKLDPCFVLDGAVRVMRVGRCFPPRGQPPFTYLGNRILYVENASGGDVHSREDLVVAEHLLRAAGWTEAT